MDDQTLLGLFGGNEESLEHYKSLRKLYEQSSGDDEMEEGDPTVDSELQRREERACSEEVAGIERCDYNLDKVLGVSEDVSYGDFTDPLNNSSLNTDQPKLSVQEHSAVFKPLDDVLYLNGEMYGFHSKQTALDEVGGKDEECLGQALDSMETEVSRSFVCGEHGCNKKFSSLSAYESHYHSCHHFVCSTCRRVLVSSFMLDIHIQENHDSYFNILCTRIDMYQCLLENCGLKFRTPDLRKDHLVKVHKYPANFSFHKPIFEKKSAVSPNKPVNEMEFEGCKDVTEERSGVTQVKPNKIPAKVCFGRGQSRSFQRRPHQKKRLNIEKPMEER